MKTTTRKFERLLTNVVSGKVAKIEGSPKELQDAEKVIRNLSLKKRSIVGEKQIAIYRQNGVLSVSASLSLRITLVPSAINKTAA